MQYPSLVSPDSPTSDDALEPSASLMARIAAQLRPVPSQPLSGVLARLGARAGASIAAHRNFVTVRREQRPSLPQAPGYSVQPLRVSPAVRVEMALLEPHAELPGSEWPQELLVLQGALIGPENGPGWLQHQHLMRGVGSPPLRAGSAGARVYVRNLIDPKALGEPELAWWAGEDDQFAKHWWPLAPGVDVKNLRGRGSILSMLVRMVPGALLGDHGHPQEEDCLVLDGELFLGDILLRADDYHMAPVETQHVEGYSDVGTLLFVHGAMPS